jgi:CelD/BcsL family acetyltransferase involved in cellulose biosynthesis/GNAT superfamily N-acetyltransferase
MQPGVARGLVVRVLRELDEVRDAAAAWDSLAERASRGNPFMTPDWSLAWLESTPGLRPFVLTAMEGGRLVGVWPLVMSGGLVRRLSYVEGDVYGILCEAGDATRCAEGFARELLARRTEWDVAVLSDHFIGTVDGEAIATAASQAELRVTHLPASEYPYVDARAEKSLSDFEKRVGKKVVNEIKRRRRQLEGLGPVRVERARTPEAVAARFPQIVELHRRRWRERSDTSGFSTEERIGGMRRAAERFARASRLELDLLFVDEQLIAYSYGFVFGGRHVYYSPGFDPAYSPFSVSKILLHAQLTDVFADGLSEFDFSRGAEPYKLVWATGNRKAETLVLHHDAVRSRVAGGAEVGAIRLRMAAKASPRVVHFKRETLGKVRAQVDPRAIAARVSRGVGQVRRSVEDRGVLGTARHMGERVVAPMYVHRNARLYSRSLEGVVAPVVEGFQFELLRPAGYAEVAALGRHTLEEVVRRCYRGDACFIARAVTGEIAAYAWSGVGLLAAIPEFGQQLPLDATDLCLADCYTAPAFRGRGLAGAILRFAMAQAVAVGKKRVFVVRYHEAEALEADVVAGLALRCHRGG